MQVFINLYNVEVNMKCFLFNLINLSFCKWNCKTNRYDHSFHILKLPQQRHIFYACVVYNVPEIVLQYEQCL